MYKWVFTSKSLKQLRKLERETQTRIIEKLDYFCKSNPLHYADSITDRELGEYRFRIGNYKVIFDLEKDVLVILMVGHRKDTYK